MGALIERYLCDGCVVVERYLCDGCVVASINRKVPV